MATTSITQDSVFANLPSHIRQAIDAARAIEPQVNGRYAAAAHLVATGAVRHNPAGGFDVLSRTTGQPYHINGVSCTCKDAEYNAPWIAGRKACAHQVAAWIVAKAELLARQVQPAPAPEPAAPAPTLEHMTRAQLIEAAGLVNGVEYEITEIHIGGHGWVPILRAVENPKDHESYMIRGDFHDDELYTAHWGARWGARCVEEMTRFAAALTEKPAAPETPNAGDLAAELVPALAYYIETCSTGLKVMVTHGEQYPRPVNSFSGPDHLERAREFAATRAEAQVKGLQQATPGTRVRMSNSLLPAAWRQRMGGSQVGKAWVIYTEPVAQPAIAA